jgi:hypothetical protein
MKSLFTLSALIFIIIHLFLVDAFCENTEKQSFPLISCEPKNNIYQQERDISNRAVNNLEREGLSSDQKLVVVSKTPELFSYTLTGISALLSVITILIGVITGIGLTIVIKANKERKEIEGIRLTINQEIEHARNDLKNDYKKMTEGLKLTSSKIIQIRQAKRKLRDLLSQTQPSSKEVYLLIQKTVTYPDAECLVLYAKAMDLFETNVDIIRIIRNALLEFSRNPEKI